VPLTATGKIRIVALVEKTRYAAMPDVPSVGETVPGFEMTSWLGVFAPAGTPAPLIARLNETIVKILSDPPVKEKLATLGLVVTPVSPAELAQMIKRDTEVRAALIKAANIEPQ
jgi:tripartite-type tricarboxylate transporter receptor subunit TctC